MFDAIRKNGIRWSIAIALDRIVPRWLLRVRRFNVYEMDPESVKHIALDGVVVQWCRSEEETSQVEHFTGPQRQVVTVGSDHMRACFATIDGEMVGAFWATETVFEECGLTIRYELSTNQAWLFAAHVAKQSRRHGVYSKILSFILPDLKAAGKEKIFLAVNPDNVVSRKVHEKFARRKVGVAFAIRFLNFAFCSVNGGMSTNRGFTWNHAKQPIVIRFED